MSRFIPTPVGNTGVSRFFPATGPVHPHTRGEHSPVLCDLADPIGSSPHPWGTQAPERDGPDAGRFIPTPVGNTQLLPVPVIRSPVHPHTRGEHASLSMMSAWAAGSSPHPWGTPIRSRCRI